MGGGLMQLVAYGAQDIYLTGNPQITFFKVVYRRHTNFAVESIEQTHNGSVAAGSKISVTVSRNGDLLSQVWLSMKGPTSVVGAHAAIDNVECEVGGQVIDKQYGHWMHVYSDLTHDSDKATLLGRCGAGSGTERSLVPLQFWFCRNPGLALPLIALQYHEVKLNVTFASSGAPTEVDVWCDYVFLDTDERRRFAQVSHEYLIEQVQYSNKLNVSGTNPQNELRFNHPVKELVWTVSESGASGGVTIANVGTSGSSTVLDATVTVLGAVNVLEATDLTVKDALLQLNGHDRFKRREGKYFTKVQRYQHHSGSGDRDHRDAVAVPTPVGSQSDGTAVPAAAAAKANASIPHVYSFALKPEEHQPSGTCNFSRIDNAVLNLTLDAAPAGSGSLRVYAINYNVLRIMSGMGGLAYSN
jgi:hypothetical protein